jgi:hypothetical protein
VWHIGKDDPGSTVIGVHPPPIPQSIEVIRKSQLKGVLLITVTSDESKVFGALIWGALVEKMKRHEISVRIKVVFFMIKVMVN